MAWKSSILLASIFCLSSIASAQDLENLLDEAAGGQNQKQYVSATFKSPRLVSGHTVKVPAKNDLIFLISHRFGEINMGLNEFFGLDVSTIRLGFEYGITDRFAAGIGRSSFNKVVDGYLKYRFISQSAGTGAVPFSLTAIVSSSLRTKTWSNDKLDYLFLHRLSYNSELLFARKFSSAFSAQLSPGHIHRNIVQYSDDPNDIFYLGIGARYKISSRFSLNAEYFYPFSERLRMLTTNPLSIGVDIETGGHVFQLMLSNSRGMEATVLIPETTGEWLNGDIHFGFNIIRTF